MKFEILNLFRISIFVLAVFFGCGAPPDDPTSRIDRLGRQLRCPVCRGVPIAESPAALAKEMMEIVEEQVALGKSDEEILAFFEERYGEWALLEPKAEGMNLMIWILPGLLLIGGAIFLLRIGRRRQDTPS